jgi:hypothetical protein
MASTIGMMMSAGLEPEWFGLMASWLTAICRPKSNSPTPAQTIRPAVLERKLL